MIAIFLPLSAWAATRTVTTKTDVVNPNDGVLSLREALAAANDGDSIAFATAVFPAATKTSITVNAALGSLVVADALTLDGGERVRLDGFFATPHGLQIDDGATVYGVDIANFIAFGIFVRKGTGVVIGEDSAGRHVLVEDVDESGIQVGSGAGGVNGIVIDGVTIDDACHAPGGGCGGVESSGGTVLDLEVRNSTIIGTQGVAALVQGIGILLWNSEYPSIEDNVIGGTGSSKNESHGILVGGSGVVMASIAANIIGGNLGSGIHLGPESTGTSITDNLIGLDADGTTQRSNALHGISIFASQANNITGNVISSNLKSGIRMAGAAGGNWQSFQVIQGNMIGTDATGTLDRGNNESGIASEGSGGESFFGGALPGEGNLVSGNERHGISLEDNEHLVQGNRIGTDLYGTAAIPNGTAAGLYAGLLIAGNFIDVGGENALADLPELGAMNQVSGNEDDGIRIGPCHDTVIAGNLVGSSADGDAALGNGGDGISMMEGPNVWMSFGRLVEGANSETITDDEFRRNIILDNGGDGIRVHSTVDLIELVTIEQNLVGRGLLGSIHGNGGDGVEIAAINDDVRSNTLLSNRIEGNGGVGLRLSGVESTTLSRNILDANVACGILFENGANPLSVPAVVVDFNPYSINGTFAANTVVSSIEIFWDDEEGEVSQFLGDAEFDTAAGTFSLVLDPTTEFPFPRHGRVSALLTSSGETSGLVPWCEDGCAAAGTGSCNDGNPCTTDNNMCAAGVGCSHGNSGTQTVCDDGNACTQSPASALDTCDHGSCVGTVTVAGCGGTDFCEDDKVIRDCSDNDQCGTKDSCDTSTGLCVHEAASLECGDANKCTGDSCDPDHGCIYTPRNADFLCDHDASACTELTTCDGAGLCVAADDVEVSCPAACGTTSSCTDPAIGCETTIDCSVRDGDCSLDELCACEGAGDDCAGRHDPLSAVYDSDVDGIPDTWEINGLDTDCDGVPDYFPPSGSTITPTVWLEIDYMVDDDHSHIPKDGVTDALEQAFVNGGGTSGLRPWELIVEVSDELPHYDSLSMSGQIPDKAGCDSWILLQLLKAEHFDERRRALYHYAIMGHQLGGCTGNGGSAPIPGSNIMVTLGLFPDEEGLPVGTVNQQIGNIMHELGHNLGLRHGGWTDEPDSNVTYQSVMAYIYSPVLSAWPSMQARFDYSREDREFDEAGLDELLGFNTANPEEFQYAINKSCPGGQSPIGPLNWNCSVDVSGVAVIDTGLVEAQLDELGAISAVNGREDWWTIDPRFQCGGGALGFNLSSHPDGQGELTIEELAARGLLSEPIRAIVDPMPSCSADPLPEDGTGKIQLLVYGTSRFDVADLSLPTVTLSGAPLSATRVLDYDLNQIDDIVLEVDVGDMSVYDPAVAVILLGEMIGGQKVVGGAPLSWVTTAEDADADGVQDDCDLCRVQAGPTASADGCP